jgi:hypothetical protein
MAQQKHTQQAANRNSTIVTRRDRNGKFRTETAGRDSGISVAVSTNSTTDSTILFVDSYDGKSLRFDGREARTIYRALQKHYKFTSKSW